jgi:hypothetical protein
MNIALAHYRINDTDGVSLEMQKWYECLTKLGHQVIYITGSAQSEQNYHIDGIHFHDELNLKINQNCYLSFNDYSRPDELKDLIFKRADNIEKSLDKIVKEKKIECIFVANILSLGWNLPASIAFTNYAKKNKKIKFICVNSDIYWERELYSHPVVEFVKEILDNYLLPDLFNIKHYVISNLARRELLKRRGLYSDVLYKAINFNNYLQKDEKIINEIRNYIGTAENDIIIFNPSRIAPRKTIEFSVDFIAELEALKTEYVGRSLYNGKVLSEDSKFHLLLSGIDDSLGSDYFSELNKKMKNINNTYINRIIGNKRQEEPEKKYSYMDAYYLSDAVIVSSILEGWGNHILEASLVKKPLTIFEYPVYKNDIKKLGLKLCLLGSKYYDVKPLRIIPQEAVKKAARDLLEVLSDQEKYNNYVNKNYEICNKKFSFDTLNGNLQKMLRF